MFETFSEMVFAMPITFVVGAILTTISSWIFSFLSIR